MLLKKKRFITILQMMERFLSILMKKILIKTILMRKFLKKFRQRKILVKEDSREENSKHINITKSYLNIKEIII